MAKPLNSFYRPHKRVTFDNLYLDPVTGELVQCPSMTKQEFKFECDINNVIKSFTQTGMFKHVSARAAAGTYQDLPDGIDFQESLHQVEAARSAFMTLPSKIRSRFGNDPAEFLSFAHDPANRAEMSALGLLNPPPVKTAPMEVKLVTEPGTGGDGGVPPIVGAKAP